MELSRAYITLTQVYDIVQCADPEIFPGCGVRVILNFVGGRGGGVKWHILVILPRIF